MQFHFSVPDTLPGIPQITLFTAIANAIQVHPEIRAVLPQWRAVARLLQPILRNYTEDFLYRFLKNHSYDLQLRLDVPPPPKRLTVPAVLQALNQDDNLRHLFPPIGRPFPKGQREELALMLQKTFTTYTTEQLQHFLTDHSTAFDNIRPPPATGTTPSLDPNLVDVAHLVGVATSEDPTAQHKLDAWQERDRLPLLDNVTAHLEYKVRNEQH